MTTTTKKINIFKPHLNITSAYRGGKSVAESGGEGKIYKLSSNENPIGASPKALEAIRKFTPTLYLYSDYQDGRFQEALEEFYQGELKAGQFITTNSGVEALELMVRAFAGEGTECIISNPAFGPYNLFSKKGAATVVDVPLNPSDYSLNVDGILNAINDNTRLIFITNPNNPTGTYIPKSDMDKLMHHIPEHVVVVYDEVYYQFVDAPDYTTALPYVKEGRNIIAINSFSKAYGLAGLRIGYAYSTPKLAQYVSQLRRPFMLNTLSMEGAMAALKDTEFIQQTVDLVVGERAFLYQALDAVKMDYWKTQANFIFMKPPMSPDLFEQKMLKQNVMVRPVESFGAPGGIRVTIGTREANEAFVAGLKEVLSNIE